MVGWVNAWDSRCFPHGLNGSRLAAIALQSRFRHGHPQMLRAMPPRSWCRPSCTENRRAGLLYDFSVRKMRYDRNSYPRLIGDGMSKLTGSVAPIDHGLTVTLRVTRKSIMLISKSTTTSNQSPSCLRRRLPRRPRCSPQLRVPQVD